MLKEKNGSDVLQCQLDVSYLGLDPTAIVRLILIYCALVLWPTVDVKDNCRKPDKILRDACVGITGTIRTTPTETLLLMLAIPSSKEMTRHIANIDVWSVQNFWNAQNQTRNVYRCVYYHDKYYQELQAPGLTTSC